MKIQGLRKHLPIMLVSTLLAIAMVGGYFQAVPRVSAEETPITVPLSYITNLSNTGSTTATGTAQVWRGDAEVRLLVNGMQVLGTGKKYACWLTNFQTGAFLSVGTFTVSSNGSAVMDISIHGSLPAGYNAVLITVQSDPDPTPGTPSHQYSLIGYFPGDQAIQQQVTRLPDTGTHAEHPPFAASAQSASPPSASGTFSWLSLVPLAIALAAFSWVIRRSRQLRR